MIEIKLHQLSTPPELKLPALFINTATELKEFYVISGTKMWSATWGGPTKDMDALSYLLGQVPEEMGLEITALESVYFVSGPGSFTSLRTAVSIVNTLVQELQIPIYELSTFGYLGARAASLNLPEDTPIILKAGGMHVHQCTEDNYGEIVGIESFFKGNPGLVIADLMERQNAAAEDFAREEGNNILRINELPPFKEIIEILDEVADEVKWPAGARYHKEVNIT